MNYYDDYDYNRGYGGAGGYDYSGGYGGGRGYGGDRDSYGGRHGGQALVPARGRDNRPQGKSIPEYEKNYKEAIRTADIQKELDILKATSDLKLAKAQAQLAYNEAKLKAGKIREEEKKKKDADVQYAKCQRDVDEKKGKKASGGGAANDDGM